MSRVSFVAGVACFVFALPPVSAQDFGFQLLGAGPEVHRASGPQARVTGVIGAPFTGVTRGTTLIVAMGFGAASIARSLPTAVEEPSSAPTEFVLWQNYPNPFNPTTTIKYDVPFLSDVKIAVYNLLGQEVKSLVEQQTIPGTYTVTWDGRNVAGASVSTGVYFCRFHASTVDGRGSYQRIKKLMLIR